MKARYASLSLDLDNLWSYMKTHGDVGWESYPSYLDIVVPRTLDFLDRYQAKITFFIVGKDAATPEHHSILKSITDAGHEIGNHSYHHEQWLHLYTDEQIEQELAETEAALSAATGQKPTGFRGPGFSCSENLLKILAKRGYEYDCSTFPTFFGPLARMYYFATSKGLSAEEKKQRSRLFGKFSEGFRSINPYHWSTPAGQLLEIPVTTMPWFKVPVHASYVLYLSQFSKFTAKWYWNMVLRMCRWSGTSLSLLLHPLDFLGCDDTDQLSFFPAMKVPAQPKIDMMHYLFQTMSQSFELIPMGEHARRIRESGIKLQTRTPKFN